MNRVSRLVPELSSEECRTLLAPPLAGSPAEVGTVVGEPAARCVFWLESRAERSVSYFFPPCLVLLVSHAQSVGEGEGKDFTTSPVTVAGAHDAFRQPSLRQERLSCRVAPNKTSESASFHTCNGVADVGS